MYAVPTQEETTEETTEVYTLDSGLANAILNVWDGVSTGENS
jgi:hypothetical protein